MTKELDNLLRFAALIVIFLGIIVLALGRIRKLEKQIDEMVNAPGDTVTVTRVDTILIEKPTPVAHYVKDTQYIVLTDTQIVHDTVTKVYKMPREYMVYKDSTYRAVVSGVQPRLDTIAVYPRNEHTTITKYVEVKKKTRWGAGVQAGVTWDGKKAKPYAGVGVQYNILSW